MSEKKIRVIIADDHAMVRSGLRIFLLAFDDLLLVGDAGTGQEIINLCAVEHPDVILMDMIMPGLDGIRATQEIHKRYPKIQIIGLTSYFEADLITEMLEAGAISFLVKNVLAADLAKAIRNAYRGISTISPEIQEILNSAQVIHHTTSDQTDYQLSHREKEVLTCMAVGMSNAEISNKLVISLSTVKFHVGKIMKKLNASNRAEAVSLALLHNLVRVTGHEKHTD